MYKAKFYFPAVFQHIFVPDALFRGRLRMILSGIPQDDIPSLTSRVNFYNRLPGSFTLPTLALALPEVNCWKRSACYYDTRAIVRYFPRDCKFLHDFSDVVHVPNAPTIVKSRPVVEDNSNSILLRLNSVRNFQKLHDALPFEEKEPKLVWRGQVHREWRRDLVLGYHAHPLCDIGHVNPATPLLDPALCKPRMGIPAQLRYKFILSVEGNNYATNLKWIAQSNSLCFMPRPKHETWFMESRLQPGVHYAQIRDDYADIPEKVEHYTANPEEALAIISNLRAHFRSFADPATELRAGILAMAKYFHLSGQIDLSRILPAEVLAPLLAN